MLSFRYYNLDAYHRKAMEKEKRKGLKTSVTERTVFNDEEQRRYANMNLFCCLFLQCYLYTYFWNMEHRLSVYELLSFHILFACSMKGILWNPCILIGFGVYYMLSNSFLTCLKKSCRLELLKERERRKEEEVEALKRSMQAGLVRLILCSFCQPWFIFETSIKYYNVHVGFCY